MVFFCCSENKSESVSTVTVNDEKSKKVSIMMQKPSFLRRTTEQNIQFVIELNKDKKKYKQFYKNTNSVLNKLFNNSSNDKNCSSVNLFLPIRQTPRLISLKL